MNKKLVLLFLLICCFLVPKVRSIEKIEETYFWDSSGHAELFYFDQVEDGEQISWSFDTYDNPFKVSILFIEHKGNWNDEQYLCSRKVEDNGIINVYALECTFFFTQEEEIDGYIHIVIENYTISSYPLFLIVGTVGLSIIVIIIKSIRKNVASE